MAAIVSGFQLKSELTYGATPMISQNTIVLEKGKNKKLKVSNVTNKTKIKWKTSNKFAVTVSKKGKIKAVNYGAAVVSATCKGYKLSCRVNVPDTSKNVLIKSYPTTLVEGTTGHISTKSQNRIYYMSSNESIAKVDENGNVTGINPGKAEITAKTSEGYGKCVVNVLTSDVKNRLYDSNNIGIKKANVNGKVLNQFISNVVGQTINIKLDGVAESKVKTCKWSIDDKTIITNPKTVNNSKILQSVQTLKVGQATVTAKVKYTNNTTVTYTATIYVTNPQVNTSNLTVYGKSLGGERQQYISFTGLSSNSTITWKNSNEKCASLSIYDKKAAVWGIKEGTGTITANVDGKSFKIKYTVVNPEINTIKTILKKNQKVKIPITGETGSAPVYTSRNSKIAKVSADGIVKGKKSGVTYIDVEIGTLHQSYRVEVYAKGMNTIINRANYIVNHWKYSQPRRMSNGYYDCSSLVWKGYKAYKKYNKKLGSTTYAKTAASLFDYLREKNQIVYYGFTGIDDMKPGDLIFYGDYNSAVKYSTPGRTLNIYHVAMYAGGGRVVEKGGQSINYNNISHIVGIGRVVN